ncbi:MAG: hypothetical protein PHD03_03360 [Bacilli bacterium]|nr:hypothetical protein [Bacilli bacterium]
MLFFKAFFRKKKTRIYSIVFTILLLIILTLFSFINYYNVILNKWNITNSIILVEGVKNHIDEFKKYSNIINVEKYVKFTFDKEKYPVLKQDTQFIDSDENTNIDDNLGNDNTTIKWNDFTLDRNYILIFESENNKLKNNELELFYNKEDYRFSLQTFLSDIENLKGEKISFYSTEGKELEYRIAGFHNYNIPAMFIEKKKFNELYEENSRYTYKITIDDYKKTEYIYEKLRDLEPNNNEIVNLLRIDEPYENNTSVSSILSILEIMNICLIFLFIIMFLIIINNLIFEENRNLSLQKYLGFNKLKRKFLLFSQVLALSIISIISSFLISIFTNLMIYNFSVKIQIVNFSSIIPILIIMILINLIIIITKKEC